MTFDANADFQTRPLRAVRQRLILVPKGGDSR